MNFYLKEQGKLVKILTALKQGANIDYCKTYDKELIQLFTERLKVYDCMSCFASPNNPSLLNINQKETALHLATKNGFTKVVRWLINQKANTSAQSQNKKTILYLAIEKGFIDIIN